MASSAEGRDLIVLVPGGNDLETVKGLLSRPEALGIREVAFEVVPHAKHDPGCFLQSPDFLRSYAGRYRHALVLFDREGSGREEKSREALEEDLERRLSAAGWENRAAAVVMDPELEVWIWSDSPHVDEVLGWKYRRPTLRSWLVEAGFLTEGELKPERPKEAVEKALRLARKPRSSARYRQLAERVSFHRCEDPAFQKLKEVLQGWFPVEAPPG